MVVLLCLLLLLQGLTVPLRSVLQRRGSFRAVATNDEENIHEMKNMLKLEIKEIVTSFLAQIVEKDTDIMKAVNPLTLGCRYYNNSLWRHFSLFSYAGDNAYILAKNTLYEEVMEELLLSIVDTKQVEVVQRIDAILKGFIQTERKTRSRLKLNYILAGIVKYLLALYFLIYIPIY